MSSDALFSLPKDETLWVHGHDENGDLTYVITSTKMRDRYFLYLIKDGQIEKKLKASSPEKFRRYLGQEEA